MQFHEILLAALRHKEAANRLVGGEDGASSAQLCAHVGDGGALGHLHGGDAGADVLVHTAQTALDRVAAEHFEDDVLAGTAGPQLAGQGDANDLGHLEADGQARHGGSTVHAAAADGQHTDGAAGGGVAVGAEARFARDAEAGILHAVHDAVAGAGKVDAVLLGDGSQEDVVIGGVGVDIQQVVVEVADRHLGAHPLDAHAFQSQIAHDGVDVVGEGLVELDIDLIAGVHGRRLGQMGGKDLPGQIHAHNAPLSSLFLFFTAMVWFYRLWMVSRM